MKQIAKWTLLCIVITAVGFAAIRLVAQRDQVARTLTAMLAPAPALSPDVAVEALALDPVAPALDFAAETGVGTLSIAAAPAIVPDAQTITTTPGALTAVGTVELVEPRQVVLEADGRVDTIAVEEGDAVATGDVLITLDTTFLDWAVEQAEIGFESARIDFEELGEVIKPSDIAVAEANLLLAQENFAETQRGPTAEELAAAESSVAAAWAAHAELLEQPTTAQINLALANLKKAEIAVQAAQREYDKIAWLPEAAATSAADTLQQATIDLEAARAAYDEANKPATESELQSAVAAAQSAQAALNELRLQPTAAAVAGAQAEVAAAEAALAELQEGPKESELRKGELAVRQAMIDLEAARLAQQNAQVVAPIDGTILTIDIELGQQAAAGSVVATMADTAHVDLVVNVEQKDISRVSVGQPVVISIYALPADTFFGVVDKIAPMADAGTGFVTFPVIIRLTEGPLEKVLPGMTASAAFAVDESAAPAAPAVEATAAPTEAAPAEEAEPEVTSAPTAEPEAEATPEPEAEATTVPEAEATAEPEPSATPTASN
jgi:HlyD family secretion protein